jgi:hypothetical protein
MNTSPALTLMNKTGNWLSRFSVMNPEDVVPIAIDGLLKGKEVIIPGYVNKFFMVLNKILPGWIKRIITNRGMKKLNGDTTLIRYLPESTRPVPAATAMA